MQTKMLLITSDLTRFLVVVIEPGWVAHWHHWLNACSMFVGLQVKIQARSNKNIDCKSDKLTTYWLRRVLGLKSPKALILLTNIESSKYL